MSSPTLREALAEKVRAEQIRISDGNDAAYNEGIRVAAGVILSDESLKAVEELLSKLPKTADGVPIYPGMTVYFSDGKSMQIKQLREQDWQTGTGPSIYIDPWWCTGSAVFSTQVAALASL
jgi:hypothetical protein